MMIGNVDLEAVSIGKLLEAMLTDGGRADGKGCAEAVLTIDDADVLC